MNPSLQRLSSTCLRHSLLRLCIKTSQNTKRCLGNTNSGRSRGRGNLALFGALGGASIATAYSFGFFDASLPKSLQIEARARLKAAEEEDTSDSYSYSPIPPDKSRRLKHNFLADVVAQAQPAVVFIQLQQKMMRPWMSVAAGSGSGSIVRSDGVILTNAHVVAGASARAKITVRLHDGREFEGKVLAVDPSSDLATVKIDATNLPCLKLADSSQARPGEFVVALGSPLSLTNTVTTGVISSTARRLTELVPGYSGQRLEMVVEGARVDLAKMEYLQTDVAINGGNSGGPLVNLDGELVGVNSMTIAPATGISFAIPADHARRFLRAADRLARTSWTLGSPSIFV